MSHIERFENQTDAFDFENFSERLRSYEFERDWIEMIEDGEVFVHEGDLSLEGDLTYEDVAQSCSVVVYGDLTVSGKVDCSAFNLVVTGDLKAGSVESGCDGHLSVDGNLEVDGYLSMSFNDTTTDVAGDFRGAFVFDSEHCNNVVEKVDGNTLVFDLYNDDSDIIKSFFKPGMWEEDDEAPSEEGYEAIQRKENVLRYDVLAIKQALAQISENPDDAVNKLSALEGIGEFRQWKAGIEGATVLHDLISLEAQQDDYQKWIENLTQSGVPIDAASTEGRYTPGLSTPMHYAISKGNGNAARAFSEAGADVNASENLSTIILKPIRYCGHYPDRLEPEELIAGISLAKENVALAREFGYKKVEELDASVQKSISLIEAHLNAEV